MSKITVLNGGMVVYGRWSDSGEFGFTSEEIDFDRDKFCLDRSELHFDSSEIGLD